MGELGYTLVIDIDMGGLTLKTSQRVKPFRDNLVLTTFDKFGDLDTAYQYILKNDPKEWSKVLGIQVERSFDCMGQLVRAAVEYASGIAS